MGWGVQQRKVLEELKKKKKLLIQATKVGLYTI